MKRVNRSRVLLIAVGAASWLAATPMLRAQYPGASLTEPAYRELRRLSRGLDERARDADDRAHRRESWISRRDRSLLRSIDDFSASVGRFDERFARYRAAPWRVDDDLRSLLQTARDIQDRVRRSRYSEDQTLSDWNEIVEMLNRMVRVNQSRDGVIDSPPAESGRDEYGERGRPPAPRETRELAGLARELEDQAARAHALAQRATAEGPYRREFFQSIRDFHDQAVTFRRNIDSGAMDRSQVRAEARRLYDSARRTDERLRRERAFPAVWPDWQGAMQVLQRISSLVGG